jgi:hypothetical protein
VSIEIEKVTDYLEIMEYQIMAPPGLAINEKLVSAGRIPREKEIADWLHHLCHDLLCEMRSSTTGKRPWQSCLILIQRCPGFCRGWLRTYPDHTCRKTRVMGSYAFRLIDNIHCVEYNRLYG